MADNVIANAGSGGATFATDQRSSDSAHFPLNKLAWGALDTFNIVDTSAPFPIQLRNSGGTAIGDATTPIQVSLANTAANATAVKTDGSAVTQPVSIASAVTVAQGTATSLKTQAENYVGGTAVSNANPIPVSDAGGSLTVDNAGTFAVQAAQSGTWTVTGSGGTFPVTDSGGSLTVDNAGTFAVQATSVPSDPFGANADAASATGSISAKLRFIASTGIPITGTVTVGSHNVTNAGTFAVQATVAAGATNIAKAEDVASADADVGVPAMAVRKATPANTSGTDGDYEMLQMSAGRLWCSSVIDTALPAGTNAIGKLAANTGVTIGAVEIAAAQTLSTVTTVSTVTSLTQFNGNAIATGAGVTSSGTLRVVLPTDQSVIPVSDNSGSLTVDQSRTSSSIEASLSTDAIMAAGTALTPKFAKISCSTSGENTLVAAVTSKKIRVLSLALTVVGTALSIYFKDGAAGTAIFADGTNPIPLDKTGATGAGGLVLGFNPTGWMQSASGAALILNLSTAQAVAGALTYVEV